MRQMDHKDGSPCLVGLDDPDRGLLRIVPKQDGAKNGAMAYLIAYLVCILVMGGLDFFWLSNTSGPLHRGGPWMASIIAIPWADIRA